MQRTITVKGTGSATAAPDLIRISMSLESKEYTYALTMKSAEEEIESLKEAIVSAGFDRKDLKTLDFDVRTEYNNEKDHFGNYQRIFKGYTCTHQLKLEFDLDTKRLASALNAIADCSARPTLSIDFTVKDPTAISTELLRSAAVNARVKAETLCAASGVKLGDLLTISYNWGEIDIVSRTDVDMPMAKSKRGLDCNIEIEPDDISLSDTATFIWEIK